MIIARSRNVIYINNESIIISTKTYVKVHSRAVKVVMYFQLSPYCEYEEEFKSFSEDQKFFLGTDFVI